MAPNDCQSYLDRLVTTHTDKQINIPKIEDGNITIDKARKTAATYGAARPGRSAQPPKKAPAKKSSYDEHPDRAAKRNAILAKQVKVRVPVFSRNETIREVQHRQMYLLVATVIQKIGEVHESFCQKYNALSNIFTGSDQGRHGLSRARGLPPRADRPDLEGRLEQEGRADAATKLSAINDLRNVIKCKTFKSEVEKYITASGISLYTESVSPSLPARSGAAKSTFQAKVKVTNRFEILNYVSDKLGNTTKTEFSVTKTNRHGVTRKVGRKVFTHVPSKTVMKEKKDETGHTCVRRKASSGTFNTEITQPRFFSRATRPSINPKPYAREEPRLTKPRITKNKILRAKIASLGKRNGLQNYSRRSKKRMNNQIVRRADFLHMRCTNPLKLSTERPEAFFERQKT